MTVYSYDLSYKLLAVSVYIYVLLAVIVLLSAIASLVRVEF